MVVVLLWGYIGYAYPPSEPGPARVRLVLVATPLILAFSALMPVSVAFAILVYRLFDIDRVINCTLVYAILTGVLGLTYLVGMVLLQNLSVKLGMGRSPFAVVLSTLGIARLFSPLRQRVQVFIDRRCYRHQYDIEQTLATFGSQLSGVFEVDSLASELISVIEETLQPRHASLWIRDPKRSDADRSLNLFVQDTEAAA